MSRPQLALVQNLEVDSTPVPFSHMLADHHAMLQGYLDTHITRNHSDRTTLVRAPRSSGLVRELRDAG
jgi:hypothetical protein